ncbi:hypothetical protein [Ketobacter alkanivorans]|uniref:Uncharacterized protein n=1 Tax=Ketobacter alkanivorans TaxID=1917421 RepID=A0A2K9LJA8_9GAMM|nr:hypothetical protein [Ketobacter alkanivorans]AUM12261.1 hypothetical protein Kalk_07480 [Ketobacter alkanivorans]MCP5014763.1 hypothetical protein [Ketobacter sp.]
MEHKEILDIAESLRRQARKAVSKFQTELDLKGGLVDAMRIFGESALYGRIMLEHLEPIFNALDQENTQQAEKDVLRYLSERNEFLTGMKPWVPSSTDIMDNMLNMVNATVIADLIEAFKE